MSVSKARVASARRILGPIVGALLLMLFGADLFATYVVVRHHGALDRDLFTQLGHAVTLTLFLYLIVRTPRDDLREPSLARSGTAVVLISGIAAAFFLAKDATSLSGLLLPAAVLAVTIVGAIALYRFASNHAADIGEARFDTTGGPD